MEQYVYQKLAFCGNQGKKDKWKVNDTFKKIVIRHDNNRIYINNYEIINLDFFGFY